MRILLNSVWQCCSKLSPTILVLSFAFMSFKRSISSSLSSIAPLYFSTIAASRSFICVSRFFKSLASWSRSFSIGAFASATANFFAVSAAANSPLSFSISASSFALSSAFSDFACFFSCSRRLCSSFSNSAPRT